MNLTITIPPYGRESFRRDEFSRSNELVIRRRDKQVMEC